MDGRNRKNIQIGAWVAIVQKNQQQTGEETEGRVKRILTKSPHHPHGIKVMLNDESVGRVAKIFEDQE